METKIWNLIVMGPPGSGKGTQARLLVERLGLAHLEAGNILRDYVASKGPRAAEIDAYMQAGKLVPTDFLLELLEEKLKGLKSEQGTVFDGYARRLPEAKAVEEKLIGINRQLDKVFLIKVDKEKTLARIKNRLNCRACDQVLILGVDVSSESEPCPKCGGELYHRQDDTMEKMQSRWEVFETETMESINYFKEKGILIEINGDQAIEDVYKEIISYL